jgi:hypothetical protein
MDNIKFDDKENLGHGIKGEANNGTKNSKNNKNNKLTNDKSNKKNNKADEINQRIFSGLFFYTAENTVSCCKKNYFPGGSGVRHFFYIVNLSG